MTASREPMFSVVVPTRQRHDTLYHTLKTVLMQDHDSFELIVMDNCSSLETAEVALGFQDPRVRYARAPRRLSMSENWEAGLSHARGTYVTILGDDDGLIPGALGKAERLLVPSGAMALAWERPHYHWPNAITPWLRDTCYFSAGNTVQELDGRDVLRRFYAYQTTFNELPMLYNAFVHRRVIEGVSAKTGRYFEDLCPDVYSGIVNAFVAGRYLMASGGLGIAGVSGHSTGMSHTSGLDTTSADRFREELKDCTIDTSVHPWLIDSLDTDVGVANTLLRTKDLFFPQDEDIRWEVTGLIRYMAMRLNQDPSAYEKIANAILAMAQKHHLPIAWEHLPPRMEAPTQAPRGLAGGVVWLDCKPLGVSNVYEMAQVLGGAEQFKEAFTQSQPASVPAPAAPVSAPQVSDEPPARVVYHAPIYDPSGYADEARHLIQQLDEFGIPVAARPLGRHSSTFQAQTDPAVRRVLDRALARAASANFIHVIHFPGGAFQRLPEAGYRIGRTMFETDSLPKDWVAACNLMDEVWVPSEFNQETFRRAGVTTKLVTVPGGIDTFRFRPGLTPRRIPGARGTVFLSVFEWSFRKGWDVLLQAWARAFSPDSEVTLVLRTYPINKTEGEQDMDAWVTMFLREGLKLERHQVAPIVVIKDQVPDAEMPNLYAAANAYVAPSRGEGWGRPQMEAMACGLPVIATRWSGNLAFMTDENSLLLDIDGVVPIDGRAEMEIYHGQKWAEPSIDHLVTLLRRVASEPQAMAAIGQRARADMERHWRWEKAAAVAAERLTAIAADLDACPPQPSPAPDTLPIQWEGTQLNYHSFAMVNRELAKRLIASGRVELAAVSKEPIEFKPTPDLVPVERAIAHRLTRPPAVTVRHQWPPDFTPPASGAWVMVQPWEFGGLPDAWVAGMRHGPDEMWVYTHWLRDCYIKSGLPADRVHVVPLGVDVERYAPEGPAYPLKTQKRFKFLFLGGAIPRKGVDVLLEAYLNTFTADDDVCLVIKGIGGETFYSNSPMIAMIRQLLEQSAGDPRMPEIEYLDASLSDEEVASMYRACDALVHPYRGEGFGLPVAEAMACGLPVIVTAEGACRDFCDEETAYLVPAIEVPLAMDELGPSRVGYWWAEPDRQALGAIMREVAAAPEAAREVGRRGRARIAEHFTWDRAAAIALSRLEGLTGQTPVRQAPPDPFRPGLAPMPLDEHRRVVFFHHPDWSTDAWRDVVASYLRAFDAETDATLALWLDPRSGVSADLAAEAIMEVVAESGLTPEAIPDLLMVPDPLEPDQLARLYTAADWVVPGGDPVQAERAAKVGKPVLRSLDVDAWRAALSS